MDSRLEDYRKEMLVSPTLAVDYSDIRITAVTPVKTGLQSVRNTMKTRDSGWSLSR